MSINVPLIGFDRFVDIDWCRRSLDAAASQSSLDAVRDQVALMLPGVESQRKTLDVLKRLSTNPFEHLVDFVGRGIAIYRKQGANALLPLVWGASIASYPFFGKTSETVGRLLALQGDCAIKDLQRRMAEKRPKRIPAFIQYRIGKIKYEKKPDAQDLKVLQRIQLMLIPNDFPTDRLPDCQMTRVGRMRTTNTAAVHFMFLARAAQSMAFLWRKAKQQPDHRVRQMLMFFIEQGIRGMSVLNRYKPIQHGRIGGSLR